MYQPVNNYNIYDIKKLIINQKREIKITNNEKTKIYSALEIYSYIIKHMVKNAENYLNKKIKKLVITVPSYFNDIQKKLIRQAAEVIGLKVLKIIDEPIAAALAYKFDSKKEYNKNILIFDLGSTFNISILTLQKNEKDNSTNFEVLSNSGDINFGGKDFDNILIDIVLNKVNKYIDINTIRENKKAMKRLKNACKYGKEFLSKNNYVFIDIENIIENVNIFQEVERYEFEEGCKPLFDKIKIYIKKALEIAKLDSVQIHEIILVGGSTHIPKIKELIIEYFPESKINDYINSNDVVAFGATIEAAKILYN